MSVVLSGGESIFVYSGRRARSEKTNLHTCRFCRNKLRMNSRVYSKHGKRYCLKCAIYCKILTVDES